MEKYPFIGCTSPSTVVNDYGDVLTVPCGHCSACLSSRSYRHLTCCRLEAESSKYCYFVTLTFDNDHIPFVYWSHECDEVDTLGHILFSSPDGELLSKIPFSHELYIQINEHLKKSSNYIPDAIPYISVDFAQKFLKRLRKNISKFTDEKIRYYIVSEYGPRSLRPHLHCLFFFNSDVISSIFGEVLHKSWTFGNIDYSLSRGHAAEYTAGYVNSFTTLPKLYKYKPFRPFCIKSRYFGVPRLSDASFVSDVHSRPIQSIVSDLREQLGASSFATTMFGSFKARFFPKCTGFRRFNFESDFLYYTLYDKYKSYDKECESIRDCVISLLQHIYFFWSEGKKYLDSLPSWLSCFIQQHCQGNVSPGLDCIIWRYTDFLENYIHNLYHIFYISSIFHNLCVESSMSATQYIHRIYDFYDAMNYDSLYNQYVLQEMYYDEYEYDDASNILFYNGVDSFDFQSNELFKKFKIEQDNILLSKIKHKEQNDIYINF